MLRRESARPQPNYHFNGQRLKTTRKVSSTLVPSTPSQAPVSSKRQRCSCSWSWSCRGAISLPETRCAMQFIAGAETLAMTWPGMAEALGSMAGPDPPACERRRSRKMGAEGSNPCPTECVLGGTLWAPRRPSVALGNPLMLRG